MVKYIELFRKPFSIHIILVLCFILKSKNLFGEGQNSKYINIVIDEELYYPISELSEDFTREHDIILNMKFVKDGFYKSLNFDKLVDVFITKSINRKKIETVFNLRSSSSIWQSSFGICGENSKIEKTQKDIGTLKKIVRRNAEYLLLVEGLNDAFIFKNINTIESAKRFDNSIKSIGILKSEIENLALINTALCSSNKNLSLLDFQNTLKMPTIDYRIFITHSSSNNAEVFNSFIVSNSQTANIVKKYNLKRKPRQFHE